LENNNNNKTKQPKVAYAANLGSVQGITEVHLVFE